MSSLRFARLLNSAPLQQALTKSLSSPSILATKNTLSPAICHPVRSIVSKANQDESFQLPPPFPYKSRKYFRWYKWISALDNTKTRMNANSKIITIDGNIGSKKEEFAKELAARFGFHYIPEPRFDEVFINEDGFDYRSLNKYIVDLLWCYDEKMYYENPYHKAVPRLKINYYRMRYKQYVDALAHLFNTGEGVVLERSPFSDFVFAEAMKKSGFMPTDAYDYYYRARYDTIHQLLRPHLVIYLDASVDTCLKNIKERNIPWQVNSPVLTKEHLTTIEESYKNKYLPDIARYSEMIAFNWDKPGDMDDVVRELESLNMDYWDLQDDKFSDWSFYWNEHWDDHRYYYTTQREDVMYEFCLVPTYDTDSIHPDNNDCVHRENVYEAFVPGYGIEPLYNHKKRGLLKAIFAFRNHWKREDWNLRYPYY